MARSFLAYTFALEIATLILLGAAAAPASAQPMIPALQTPPAPKPEADRELQELVQLMVGPKRDIGDSIRRLDGTRKFPELPRYNIRMYQLLVQADQPAAARCWLEHAVRETPSDPEPYLILGRVALQEKRIADAAMDLDKAKQLLASYSDAKRKDALEQQTMSGIAQVAEARQEWEDAEKRLRDLLKAAPEDLAVHQRLARALFWQGKAPEAYNELKKAKQIDHDNVAKNKTKEALIAPEAIMAGYYYEFEGTSSYKPEEWYRAAAKEAMDDLLTRQAVALWALEVGKIDFAKKQADAILEIEAADRKLPTSEQKYPNSLVGGTLRGVVALWEKDWPLAEDLFQKVVQKEPKNVVARNNLALALVEQDDPAKKRRGLDYAQANYCDQKNSPDILSTLGWVYYRRGEFDLAEFALEQSVKSREDNVTNADSVTYQAHVLYHQGEKWQVKEILEIVLKGDRPFAMRPEARQLYEQVKDAEKPQDPPPPLNLSGKL